MVTKEDVKIWLGKCKHKAMQVVEKEIGDFLSELADKYTSCTTDYQKIMQDIADINAYATKYNTSFNVIKNDDITFWNDKVRERFNGIDVLTVNYIYEHDCKEDIETLEALCLKSKKVEREYLDLIDICNRFRKAEKAVKYLQELGFNTETLVGQSVAIDKNLIFVCGDNKPDVTKEQE